MREYKNFVVGCNSYLGVNFCRQLDAADTLLCSRSNLDPNLSGYFFESCDLSVQMLKPVACENLYLFSRPISCQETILDQFYRNCTILISECLNLNPELKVHFISTSLVYASDSSEFLTVNSPVCTPGLYERKKYEMESVLRDLSADYTDASFNIHRIPLLAGGLVRNTDKQQQIFYKFYSAYREGNRWLFDYSAPDYGTSFLSVSDFSIWLNTAHFGAGWSVHLPSSGQISYRDLQTYFDKISMPLPIKTTMLCPSSFLYIANNTALEERRFEDLFIL